MGHRSVFLNYDVSPSLMIVFTLTNSVNPDEMPHNAAFHLGIHCLSTRLGVSSIQRVKNHVKI